ncbi:MAG: GMC oxidoreductase [Sphingomonas sp.]|uniref:GMC oxidoreductase n=1 Tax=Sphingomonas sp. TaxID=28214 RepID=UPI003F7F0F7F
MIEGAREGGWLVLSRPLFRPLAGFQHRPTLDDAVRRRSQGQRFDLRCKAHELDNLYVVDSSIFPSSSEVNPTLTIVANAMRVGVNLRERLT